MARISQTAWWSSRRCPVPACGLTPTIGLARCYEVARIRRQASLSTSRASCRNVLVKRDKALIDMSNRNPMCFREFSHAVNDTDINVAPDIELLTVGIEEVEVVDPASADRE